MAGKRTLVAGIEPIFQQAVSNGNPARYAQKDRPFLEETREELLRLLDSGAIDPLIHLEVPLEDAARAIGELTNRKTVGKVIVHVEAPQTGV